MNPKNDKVYGGLAQLYEDQGQLELAKKYRKKANKARVEYSNFEVSANYLKQKEVLDQKGVKLVCVQYPNRSAKPLRNIFRGQKGVVFVDNEKIFEEAVNKEGYKEYFLDAFAGGFGHCTRKGNRLLAENIANIIMLKIFNGNN